MQPPLDFLWSPDESFIMCNTTGHGGYALCSLAGRCWLEFEQPPEWALVYAYTWGPLGVIGSFCVWEGHPIVQDITACVEPYSGRPQRLDERLDSDTWECSPDCRWAAASQPSALHILCCRTLTVVASMSCQQGAACASHLCWATTMSALLLLDDESRPLQVLRFL